MKVKFESDNFEHKDVYRNLMYVLGDKYSFKGESNFDNDVAACTDAPNYEKFDPNPDPPTPPVPPTPTEWWGLKLTTEEPNSTIKMANIGLDGDLPKFQKSFDNGKTWSPLELDDETITLENSGDEVCISATDEGNETLGRDDGSGCFAGYIQFEMTGKISASGDISSLLDNKNSVTDLTGRNFVFFSLFSGCSSLTTPPVLPATALANNCYDAMFAGCTSLTTAPDLPATTLSDNCYISMFNDCTSLTTAPDLPAPTLINSCYNSMFDGCISLNSITVGFTSWNTDATSGWLYNTASSGNFNCPEALDTTIARGSSTIPENWTINK